MDALQHRLTQYKGSPGQGSTVKSALNVHHAEIKTLIALVGALQAQVAKLETALQPEAEPEPEPTPTIAKPSPVLQAEACPVLAVAAVVAPVVAAVVLPAVAAALSSKPAALSSKPAEVEPQVVGHYSVMATPASSGNDLPIPVAVQATAEGSSTDDSVEAILLEAEQHSADRYMSLAKHQQATTAKVRAAAARKRAATPRPKRPTATP
jgi:xanthosine utilization system XapX-like protein